MKTCCCITTNQFPWRSLRQNLKGEYTRPTDGRRTNYGDILPTTSDWGVIVVECFTAILPTCIYRRLLNIVWQLWPDSGSFITFAIITWVYRFPLITGSCHRTSIVRLIHLYAGDHGSCSPSVHLKVLGIQRSSYSLVYKKLGSCNWQSL